MNDSSSARRPRGGRHRRKPPARRPRRTLAIIGGALVLLLVLAFGLAVNETVRGVHASPTAVSAADGGAEPSIVVIVTDDQRWDTLRYMPTVRRDLVDRGVTFRNAFVVNSACCPSRASILTGEYSHSTGVYTNRGAEGGYNSFNPGSTIATWLDGTPYESALMGKYLNNYEAAVESGEVEPPLGWDHWVVFPQAHYETFSLNIDGEIHSYESGAQYSTDVLADEAVRWISDTPGPLFLYFAPKAPHWPATVVGDDAKAFADLPPWRPASYDEADMSDKPSWDRDGLRLDDAAQQAIEEFRRGQLQTLLPVDRAVGRIIDALDATGRLDNAMIIFTSDNGMLWGEHRLRGKGNAYEESIRVPFVVRDDALVQTPRPNEDMVLNIDIAPTVAALAGVDSPGAEGTSLLPLLEKGNPPWRKDFLIEHFSPGGPNGHPPTFCAVRTQHWKYVDYFWGEDELYDIQGDPLELTNRIGDTSLTAVLDDLKKREKVLCDPPPPHRTSELSKAG